MRRKNPEIVGDVYTGIFKLIIIVIAVAVSFLLNIFTSHEISIIATEINEDENTNYDDEV